MFLNTITEGYGRTYEFPYEKFSTDPRPRLLLLGKYRHPSTKNVLLGGINLNYLNDEQLKTLRQNLKTILQPKNLQLRYWRGRRLLPEVFDSKTGAYRTYDVDYVGSVTKDTLTFWPSVGELEQAERAAKEKDMQQYDQEMRAQHKIGRQARPSLATPEPPEAAPEPADVLTTEPEPVSEPTQPKMAPPAEVELARPETEVTPEPTTEVGKEPSQKPAQAGPAGAPTEQPEVETPPARGLVRGGAGGEKEGAGAPLAAKAKRLTSAQRRRQQADQIKKALEATKAKKQKPEPPDEIKGIMGMFRPKK